MSLAQGQIVCLLEGGYDLDDLAKGATAVISTLLGDTRPCAGINFEDHENFMPEVSVQGRQAVEETAKVAGVYWGVDQQFIMWYKGYLYVYFKDFMYILVIRELIYIFNIETLNCID